MDGAELPTATTPPSGRWHHVELSAVRDRAASGAITETSLNPEAEAMAAALRHPRLDPAAVQGAVAVMDCAALTLAGLVALVLAGNAPGMAIHEALAQSAALAAAVVTLLALARGYRLRALRSTLEALLRVGAASVAVVAGVAMAGVWAPSSLEVAPMVVAAHATALILLRLPVVAFVRWCREGRITERRAVVVGGGGNAERLIRGLEAQPDSDIRIVALFDDRGDDRSPPLVAGCRKLGAVAELVAFARIAAIDLVIVTLPLSAEARILSLLRALWVLPVDIRLSAYSSDYVFPRRGGEAGLIGLLDNPLRGAGRWTKRGLDILGAAALLIAVSPIMLATALAIRFDSPGPILFRQARHGFNHRPVDVLKFRSMRAETCDPQARSIVVRGDPRVTRVGRFIRRTSIDELPQLFNVLRGDMSLVGPRPHAVNAMSSRHEMFAEIVEGYSGRHKVPPGITGWAQINGWRGEIDTPEALRQRFEHDLHYIENRSLSLDLYILARTPFALLDTRRAY